MPHCQNCNAHVTIQYVRVFAPNGAEDPRVCPHCEDKVRDGVNIRETKAPR